MVWLDLAPIWLWLPISHAHTILWKPLTELQVGARRGRIHAGTGAGAPSEACGKAARPDVSLNLMM